MRLRGLAAVAAAVAVLVAPITAVTASAGNDCPTVYSCEGTGGGGSSDGAGNITAWASRVSYSGSGYTGGGAGNVRTVDWEPPACWCEPWKTPAEFQTWARRDFLPLLRRMGESAYAQEFVAEYEPYHVGDGGLWYTRTCLDYSSDAAKAHTSSRPWAIWVNPQESNKPADAISADVLADLAVAHMTLPTRAVGVNPTNTSFVNLGTWVWSSDGMAPVSVTASLGPVSSTVTATPSHLRLDPGTSDARLHPASGVCTGVGQAYSAGASDARTDPPCGVTYTRSTAGKPGGYPLEAELVWDISWSSTSGDGGTLPGASTSTTTPVQVAEVQTLVTGTR